MGKEKGRKGKRRRQQSAKPTDEWIFRQWCWHIVLQVFLRYDQEEELMSLIEVDRRRVVRVQSCVRRWSAVRRVGHLRQLHSHAARIQAGQRKENNATKRN